MSVQRKIIVDNTSVFDNFTVEQVHFAEAPDIKYETAKRKKCVIVIPIYQDTIFMINEYRISVNAELIQFPAGKIENLEHPQEAAIRELYEETGIIADEPEYIGHFYTAPHFSDEEIFVFSCNVKDQLTPQLTNREMMQTVQIKIKEVFSMIANNKIIDSKTISAYMLWEARKCINSKKY